MKELIKEYQAVLITSIASVFVFVCVYTVIPQIVNGAIEEKDKNGELSFIKEDSSEYAISLKYPEGDKIKLVKGSQFSIDEYITILDANYGEVTNYDYTLNVNGKNAAYFDTDTCGGYFICAEINYKNTRLQGQLLIIIEER